MTVTDLIPTETAALDPVEPVATEPPDDDDVRNAGELIFIDPNRLVRAPNRPEKPEDPDFDADIAEHGNHVPIVVSRNADGDYEVEDGWHRTRALQKTAHLAWVAVLPEDLSKDEKTRVIDRVGRQFSTGKHRFAQTEADRLHAMQMLFEIDLSNTEVAKRLKLSKETVKNARIVVKSERATAAVASDQLDIIHAGMAEQFADDPDAMRELLDAERDGMFEVVFQQLVDERKRRAEQEAAEAAAAEVAERLREILAATSAEFQQRGFEVLEFEPDLDDPDYLPLAALRTGDDQAVTADFAEDNPHAFAVFLVRKTTLAETGELIHPEEVDDVTRRYPDATANSGLYHAREVVEEEEFVPIYLCHDRESVNLHLADDAAEPENDDITSTEDSAEQEAARAEAARKKREEWERQQREEAARLAAIQRTTALNNQMRSQTTRRRDNIQAKLFTDRKTVPAGWMELIGKVTDEPALLTRFAAQVLRSRLGAKVPAEPTGGGIKVRDNHGGMRALLNTVAALEAAIQASDTSDDCKTYERPNPLYKLYMELLEKTIGHAISPIEYTLTGDLTPDEVLAGRRSPHDPPVGQDDTGEALDSTETGNLDHTDEEVTDSGPRTPVAEVDDNTVDYTTEAHAA
ncbi:ParB N-terminal domain-containing protein [Nocardia sp. NPDC047038]|uniref:ParB/RepB/Spo0J family partition protein n=1 Tax=Nocardia sp. NPDC047038 TaxID=3154338 RepID=UPI0033D600EA